VATGDIQLTIGDKEPVANDRFSQVREEFSGPHKQFSVRSTAPSQIIVGFEVELAFSRPGPNNGPLELLVDGVPFEVIRPVIQIPLRPGQVGAGRQFTFLIDAANPVTLVNLWVYVVDDLRVEPELGNDLAEGISLFDFIPSPKSHHPLANFGKYIEKVDLAADPEDFINIASQIYGNPFFSNACREVAVRSAAGNERRAKDLWAEARYRAVEAGGVRNWGLLFRDLKSLGPELAARIIDLVWSRKSGEMPPADLFACHFWRR